MKLPICVYRKEALPCSISLHLYPSLEKHGGAHHRTEGISDVKFSPDGRFLASASHESVVDLYVVDTDGDIISQEGTGLRRVSVCRGASSWITHVTWHKDSRLLQVNSGEYE
ncbi:Echinoderm microtubule-associated protein-like 2 [Halocaridina rubra]|uniref:Echinoderm microtubule-associated protein-like 2 n=1 Tax=Halocaridina rubra TaxID=373956 RepID=A0AAN8WL12_HALRR